MAFAQPGAEPQLVALLEEWERERKPNARGAIGGYIFKPDGRAGLEFARMPG